MNTRAITGLLLRLSLGGIFLYFGIQAVLQPDIAMSYIPAYAEAIFANTAFITVWGVAEILIGAALVLGIYTRYASILAALCLVPIMISVGLNEVLYRDIVIFFAAIHLAYEPDYVLSIKN